MQLWNEVAILRPSSALSMYGDHKTDDLGALKRLSPDHAFLKKKIYLSQMAIKMVNWPKHISIKGLIPSSWKYSYHFMIDQSVPCFFDTQERTVPYRTEMEEECMGGRSRQRGFGGGKGRTGGRGNCVQDIKKWINLIDKNVL